MLTFLQTGDWGPADVEVAWAKSTRRTVPEVEALVERAWTEACNRPGAHLFDGPMCRLEKWETRDGGRRLRLVLSEVSYKPFLGTNMTHPELEDRFGPAVMANPVGVSPALETADGFLLLGRRNASVAYYPNRLHPFAGALEPRDGGDVFAAVRRELREELSLDVADVPEVRLAGLVREAALRQTELIFRARCRLSRAEVAARLDDREHHGVVAVATSQHDVGRALADPALTPVGAAALLLWGRDRFGTGWFDGKLAAL